MRCARPGLGTTNHLANFDWTAKGVTFRNMALTMKRLKAFYRKTSTLSRWFVICLLLLSGIGKAHALDLFPNVFYFFNAAAGFQGMIQASDGNFYGTTWPSAFDNHGSIYKITPAGSFKILHSFAPDSIFPYTPDYSLVEGSDGYLYGTTDSEGIKGIGSVFKISKSGQITTLYSFTNSAIDGFFPRAGLIAGPDGDFYGTTLTSLFKISPTGNFTLLYNFESDNDFVPDSFWPGINANLTFGDDGNFYGVTQVGGMYLGPYGNGFGTIFKVTPQGQHTTIFSFNGTNGSWPEIRLIRGANGDFFGESTLGFFRIGSDGVFTNLLAVPVSSLSNLPVPGLLVSGNNGSLYGTILQGGPDGEGSIFQLDPDGHTNRLFNFTGGTNGINPYHLIPQPDGSFYGGTAGPIFNGLSPSGTFFHLTQNGDFTLLFNGTGANPGCLVEGRDGNIYGTTLNLESLRPATIFKLPPSGELVSMAYLDLSTNCAPNSLIQGENGNFYGTTKYNTYDSSNHPPNTNGAIFTMSLDGKLTNLFQFNGQNGSSPMALVENNDGRFYGATETGGPNNQGTIFKITTNGNLNTLAVFGGSSGSMPNGLLRGSDGNFYGTTTSGGRYGGGTVFKMTPSGTLSSIADLGQQYTGGKTLALGRDGNLYGTTFYGGVGAKQNVSAGNGIIFKITTSGWWTTLFRFSETNGAMPNQLLQATDGNLYGTTQGGGTGNSGTIFMLTSEGAFTFLKSFTNYDRPASGLIQTSSGVFYGTTLLGGNEPEFNKLFGGSIFKFAPLSFSGLFSDANHPNLSGIFSATVSLTSHLSGTLTLGTQTYRLSGQVNSNGMVTVVIPRPRLPALTVTLQVGEDQKSISGTVSDGTGTAQLYGDPTHPLGRTDFHPVAGNYSMDILSDSDGSRSPGSGSAGRVTVTTTGAVTATGVLSDETTFRQTGMISENGLWPFYVSMYDGKGSLTGWITFTNLPTSRFNGALNWIKSGASGPYYSHGFTNTATVIGSVKAR